MRSRSSAVILTHENVFGRYFVSRKIGETKEIQGLLGYRNASKTGAAQEAMQNAVCRASRAITEQEARQILGVSENASWEEILKKYEILFERNAKQVSFYLQSKVHRAKECLEAVYQTKGQGPAN